MRALSPVMALSLALGCTDTSRRTQGEECVFNDDCASPLVCAGGRCRAQCRDERDCVAGQKCAANVQDGLRVCVPREHPDFCHYHSQCPRPQACGFDGLCRYQCRQPRDCGDFSVDLRCDVDAGLCLWPQELNPSGQ